jgi:23S rRNA pseudouridine1911/1915/1917 synthase
LEQKDFLHKIEIRILPEEANQRLDSFLAARETLRLTRSRIQSLIQEGRILVNQAKAKPSHKLKPKELIQLVIPPPRKAEVRAESIPLEIIYQDQDLLVVNKPAGMATHPAGGIYSGTLVNALLYHCLDLSGIGGVERPGIVHRLDKDTSGLLVVAKNDLAHLSLSRQLTDKTLFREYFALIWGKMPQKKGIISAPIGRAIADRKKMAVTAVKSREAATEYELRESFSLCELLQVRLKTGRTHQIRVHLAYLDHPVVGDPQYGGRGKWAGNLKTRTEKRLAEDILKTISRQALHARKIGFLHPRTGQYLEFESRLPEDMEKLLELLRPIS